MRKSRRGFTIIEVAIFLAVTGALFVGVTVGVSNSVNNQRKNDTVQSFVEFLRGVYSEVTNVQHEKYGRSGKVVYGKLVTFGEQNGLSSDDNGNDGSRVFVYTMIGNDKELQQNGNGGTSSTTGNKSTIDLIRDRGTTVVNENNELVGLAESYNLKWAGKLEKAEERNDSNEYVDFEGTLMIVRHPETGTVYTYFSNEPAVINQANSPVKLDPFDSVDKWQGFDMQNVDFCINTTGRKSGVMRTDVRILKGAKNASGVELVPDEENICNQD